MLKFTLDRILKVFQTSRSLIEQAFEGRHAEIEEVSYTQYFLKQGIPVSVSAGVKLVLQEELGADLSRLKHTDDFSSNLEFFFRLDSMVDVSIICALEKRFEISITDHEAENSSSVEDLVLLVNRKLRDADDAERKA